VVHHYEVAVDSVKVDETHYHIKIQNHITGASLFMVVPIEGMHAESLTHEMALQIGNTVADALRQAPFLAEATYESKVREAGTEMSAE